MTDTSTEFNGDQCMVLPVEFLQSADAAAEIYEDEIAQVVTNLDVQSLDQTPGFFQGTLLAAVLWAVPVAWTICL